MQAEERYGRGGFICEYTSSWLTLLDHSLQTLAVASISLSTTIHTLLLPVMVPFIMVDHVDIHRSCITGVYYAS